MRTISVALTSGFLLLIVAVMSVCGAVGFLAEPETGWIGAREGAVIGLGAALAVLIVHGVRIAFSRTPEAKGPGHHPASLERFRLKEAASSAFADILIVLGLVTIGSFSLLSQLDMRIVLSALFLLALGDLVIRLVVLRRQGF